MGRPLCLVHIQAVTKDTLERSDHPKAMALGKDFEPSDHAIRGTTTTKAIPEKRSTVFLTRNHILFLAFLSEVVPLTGCGIILSSHVGHHVRVCYNAT
jgi:hypothetical protein